MRKKYLLGATYDKEIVFGEVEVTKRNGYPEFTASFDSVRPFNGSNWDAEEYFEGWLEGIDAEWKYEACERYDCKPSELASELAMECNDPRDALDCSLFPECMEVNGNDWYFESGSCGQYDSREDMEVYTNKEAYDALHELWDEYHLKEVDEAIIKKLETITNALEIVNTEKWIKNYIEQNIEGGFNLV